MLRDLPKPPPGFRWVGKPGYADLVRPDGVCLGTVFYDPPAWQSEAAIGREHEAADVFEAAGYLFDEVDEDGDEVTSVPELEAAIGLPFAEWSHQCHAVSLAIVRSGIVQGRVARGYARGVGPHSWVVLGTEPRHCVGRTVPLLDPTLWSWRDDVEGLWTGTLEAGIHIPAGSGSIWQFGCPRSGGGDEIALDGLPPRAASWLDLARHQAQGPLDRAWWSALFNSNHLVGIDEIGAIVAAAHAHPQLSAVVPIDIVGMFTDINPGGLYLRTEQPTP